MTSHLSLADLNALVDGELSPEKVAIVDEHLAGCPTCTANSLSLNHCLSLRPREPVGAMRRRNSYAEGSCEDAGEPAYFNSNAIELPTEE